MLKFPAKDLRQEQKYTRGKVTYGKPQVTCTVLAGSNDPKTNTLLPYTTNISIHVPPSHVT